MSFILCVLGTVMFLEGLPYAASPNSVKSVMQKILEMPDRTLRQIGFCLMIGGLLVAYWGKN
jgi:uncharacterized protein YjeT (DUF2065 family)